jgi:hypothetical protein
MESEHANRLCSNIVVVADGYDVEKPIAICHNSNLRTYKCSRRIFTLYI